MWKDCSVSLICFLLSIRLKRFHVMNRSCLQLLLQSTNTTWKCQKIPQFKMTHAKSIFCLKFPQSMINIKLKIVSETNVKTHTSDNILTQRTLI